MRKSIFMFLTLAFLPSVVRAVNFKLSTGFNLIKNITNITKYITDELKHFGTTTLYFADDKGRLVETSLLGNLSEILTKIEDVNSKVSFRLYTLEIDGTYETLLFQDKESLEKSHFNRERPTRFITHGYLSSADGPACMMIKEAYLNNTDCNIIVIDWHSLSKGDYITARLYVEPVAYRINAMINFMEKNGLNLSTTTLIGHSLGAHIMGLAGQKTVCKVHRIIGLDPALPLFTLVNESSRISSDDASYVEVIHTNAGFLGDPQHLGHYDFYPNGGANQPGCADSIKGAACSHGRSYQLFAESLNESNPRFYALKCDSYNAFKTNRCENYDTVMGGINNFPQFSGAYYLNTASSPPYSLGKSYGQPKCPKGFFAFFQNIFNRIFGFGYAC